MSEFTKYEAYKKKLEGICDENELQYRLRMDTYPMSMTISPLGGIENQISMLEAADENTPCNSIDAKLVFSYFDGDLRYKFSERFTIGEALFSKLRNLFRNLHYTYLQMFHRDVTEKDLLRAPYKLPSPETDSNEPITEPLEVVETPDEIGMDGEMPDYDEVGLDFPEDMMEEKDE